MAEMITRPLCGTTCSDQWSNEWSNEWSNTRSSHLHLFFTNVQCARETEILVGQELPKGVFICDHAGLVINKLSTGVSPPSGTSCAGRPSGYA